MEISILDHKIHQFDLSVIISTCDRPYYLRRCLNSLPKKQELEINLEVIVIDESTQPIDLSDFAIDILIHKSKQGLYGAYAKDVGINQAHGKYVCFWDDDNHYFPNAITDLYAAANKHDIGVVQVLHTDNDPSSKTVCIPQNWSGTFKLTDIDTMCFCVLTDLAITRRWSDHKRRGTDFAWISKIAKNSNINFIPVIIGHHRTWNVQC